MTTALIIDDDADVRKLLGLFLQRYGCQTREASNGIEGQQMALRDKPDLILLDIMMDGQDGYETCANLRAASYQGTVLLVSAIPETEGARQAIQCGADGYLQKPISSQVLKEQIGILPSQAAREPSAGGLDSVALRMLNRQTTPSALKGTVLEE